MKGDIPHSFSKDMCNTPPMNNSLVCSRLQTRKPSQEHNEFINGSSRTSCKVPKKAKNKFLLCDEQTDSMEFVQEKKNQDKASNRFRVEVSPHKWKGIQEKLKRRYPYQRRMLRSFFDMPFITPTINEPIIEKKIKRRVKKQLSRLEKEAEKEVKEIEKKAKCLNKVELQLQDMLTKSKMKVFVVKPHDTEIKIKKEQQKKQESKVENFHRRGKTMDPIEILNPIIYEKSEIPKNITEAHEKKSEKTQKISRFPLVINKYLVKLKPPQQNSNSHSPTNANRIPAPFKMPYANLTCKYRPAAISFGTTTTGEKTGNESSFLPEASSASKNPNLDNTWDLADISPKSRNKSTIEHNSEGNTNLLINATKWRCKIDDYKSSIEELCSEYGCTKKYIASLILSYWNLSIEKLKTTPVKENGSLVGRYCFEEKKDLKNVLHEIKFTCNEIFLILKIFLFISWMGF